MGAPLRMKHGSLLEGVRVRGTAVEICGFGPQARHSGVDGRAVASWGRGAAGF